MNLQEKFDLALKKSKNGDPNSYYSSEKVRPNRYKAYYTKDQWEEFLAGMSPIVRKAYEDGGGKELDEKQYKGIWIPPKMASYASSSRFIYNLGKNIEGFEFEKQLKTGLGGYPANLDGYLKARNLFVEAKCHEFYSNTRSKLRQGNKILYEAIIPLLDEKFHYDAPDGIGGNVTLKWDKQECRGFDLKQMLSHLCGIANYVLKEENTKVNFIYLIYSPTAELLNNIENESDRKKIENLFNEEKKTAKRIGKDSKYIYEAILSYFNDKYHYEISGGKLKTIAQDFNFKVCTQDDFLSTIEGL